MGMLTEAEKKLDKVIRLLERLVELSETKAPPK